MNYEQKYNEMVQRAKELHESGNALTRQQMEIICPELRESEDEETRQFLINWINQNGIGTPCYIDISWKERCIAYLEKQREQKPTEYIKRNSKEWNALLAEQYDKGFWKGKAEQKPVEWSEEDEQMVQFWNMYYEHKVGDWPNKDVVEHLERFREWINNRFRTLHPQPHWKPSEEQMEALAEALARLTSQDMDNRTYANLCALKSDLKKLI